MCDPISIGVATAALSVASAGASYIGGQQQYAANKAAANYNYAQNTTALSQKASQLDAEHSQQVEDSAITAARSQGSIVASAADQGLAPTSITQQLNASMFGIGRNQSIADTNDSNARQQLATDATGADIARITQINKVAQPSPIGLVLGVGNGVLSGFNAGNSAARVGQ